MTLTTADSAGPPLVQFKQAAFEETILLSSGRRPDRMVAIRNERAHAKKSERSLHVLSPQVPQSLPYCRPPLLTNWKPESDDATAVTRARCVGPQMLIASTRTPTHSGAFAIYVKLDNHA